jgi:hypothetical protein
LTQLLISSLSTTATIKLLLFEMIYGANEEAPSQQS